MGLLDGQAEPDQLLDKCLELGLKEGERVGWGVWGIIKVRAPYHLDIHPHSWHSQTAG